MNMHRMKDGRLYLLIFLVCVFVSDVVGLRITQQSATKSTNETFFVLCKDDAGRAVAWQGPKGPLGQKTRPYVQTSSYGMVLVFNQTTVDDAGTYSCTAGNEKKEFNLTIETPLAFMDTDANQTGIEGKDVILRCEVRGGNVAWSVEGGEITGKKYRVIADGLLIKDVRRSDSKTYVCKAVQQTTGIIVDRKIKLRVLHKPMFPLPTYAKQEQAYGYLNGTVNLTCIVMADPPASFKWERKDKVEITGRVFNESSDVSILQMHVDKSTFGDYKCIAKNPYGTLEKHFNLEEGAKPHPPEFIELKGANSDLLDLGIRGPDPVKVEIAPGMETKGFRVQYRKMDAENWQIVDFNISKENSYPLRGLLHNTEYFIRAATRNAAGLSDYTKISSFSTLNSETDGVRTTSPSSLSVAINLVMTLFLTHYLALW